VCGIAGIFDLREQPIDLALLERMTRSLAHRGPDAEGLWSDANLGLGHRRLSIVDLSEAGRQPLPSSTGRFWITYNGEVYNAADVRSEKLGALNFRGHSDTEVVVNAFQEMGPDCLALFNGMFAFAIWDRLERRLFIARDRFGVKPLFYSFDGSTFVFASEIKALLTCPFVSRDPDLQTAFDFLVDGIHEGAENTHFKHIRQLAPGHAMYVAASGLKAWKWYTITAPEEYSEPNLPEVTEHVTQLFRDAVRLRFVSDVPVVSNFSGGFDSTCVVTFAVQHLRKTGGALPHPTFSACFDDPKQDERPFIQLAAAELPLEQHHVLVEPGDVLSELEVQTRRQDQPVMSAAMIAKGEVMRAVHTAGIKVTLEGQGVDEYACGYSDAPRYALADYLRSGNMLAASRELAGWRSVAGVSLWDGFKSAADMAFPRMTQLGSHVKQTLRGTQHDRVNGRFLSESFARNRTRTILPKYAERILDDYCIRQMFDRHLPFFLRCDDHNSMAFSVEARQPFLDYRLVEYILSLPGDFRIRRGISKWVFREAMRGVIPEAIRSFPGKRAFPTPQADWLVGPGRRAIEARIASPAFAASGFFNVAAVRELYRQLCAGNRRLNKPIWSVLNFDVWLQCLVR
jgi:asparagine synthase (glutamine-hydrolysing)